MVSHSGPKKFALFLLCCMGNLLSSHMLSILRPDAKDQQKIIKELQYLSKILLEEYREAEKGVPESTKYTLPCSTSDPHPSNNINSSAILPYFQGIKQHINNKSVVDEITGQLKKLVSQDTSEINVSVPTDPFERKCFILAILQQFAKCVDGKAMNSEDQKART
uniref:Interleukin 31 n=1 Tax=Loxodonta africana TaxID=9785 RepID=G3TH07_LOXAF